MNITTTLTIKDISNSNKDVLVKDKPITDKQMYTTNIFNKDNELNKIVFSDFWLLL